MATADMTALPLQEFIASLDGACLPKILQVCSGVYFQGSIYEISGSEVCFSTDDLIKVIGIEALAVCCEEVDDSHKFELPLTHTGLFKVVPEEMPYSSVEEMISMRPVGLDSCLSFTFKSHTELMLEDFTVGAGNTLTVLYVDHQGGKEDRICCRFQGQQDTTALVYIPLSVCGEFTECESEERFTLQQIISSPFLLSRRFCFVNTTMSERPLRLSLIYEVQAVMNLRKNILKFPSSLEVDVIDVTDMYGDVNFTLPLNLTEVFEKPAESFPSVIQILEGPGSGSLFKCPWLPELTVNRHLVFHTTHTSTLFLLSSLKSRKAQQYFLVSQEYGGKFRRRPREFNSVYELYVASMQVPGLQVTVTRNSEEVEEEGVPALSVGELLEVVRYETMVLPGKSNQEVKQPVDVLLCQRLQDPQDRDDDDDDDKDEVQQEESREEIVLPIFMQGHFVEVLTDNKKYSLRDLCGKHNLPLDVKLANRDPELKADPLAGLSCIRIEGLTVEPTILASFLHSPDSCFEIPARRINLSVSFTTDPLPWPSGQPPKFCIETVTQVTDSFFYEFCKMLNSGEPPPPRPPKRNLTMKSCKKSSSKHQKRSFKVEKSKPRQEKGIPTKELADLTLGNKRRPPPPPPPPEMVDDYTPPVLPRKHEAPEKSHCKAKPNTYVKMKESKMKVLPKGVSVDLDSDHDYESVDETLADVVRKAQENIMYY